MDWQAIITMGTALTGAACGITGIVLNWKTRRELKFGKRPIVTIEQKDWENDPTLLQLTLRSRSNVGYRVTSVTLVRPRNAQISLGPKPGQVSGEFAKTV